MIDKAGIDFKVIFRTLLDEDDTRLLEEFSSISDRDLRFFLFRDFNSFRLSDSRLIFSNKLVSPLFVKLKLHLLHIFIFFHTFDLFKTSFLLFFLNSSKLSTLIIE
jgi:hypothetical protein